MTSSLKNKSPLFAILFLGLFAAISAGCGGGGGGGGTPAPTSFTVGGSITGLSNTGLVLQNNGGDDLNISAAKATFTFATALNTSAAYVVSIAAQPVGQTCVVSNASGIIASANVSDVVINCTLTDNDAAGLYIGGSGDATVGFANVNEGSNYNLDFIRGIIYDNRFMFFNVDPKANTASNQNENVLIDGVISDINGTTITATASIYQAGRIVANDVPVTGTVTSRTNISLTFTGTTAVIGALAGDFNGGTLNATFSTEFDRGASMERLTTPRSLLNASPTVYNVIPELTGLEFIIEATPSRLYQLGYGNTPAVSQRCDHNGAPSTSSNKTIPDNVLNVYSLKDELIPVFGCTAVTQTTGFTGFGALMGENSTSWWYATANGLFSVYIESNTTP